MAYIEREAALAATCQYCSAKEDCLPNERCADYELVNSIPAADVAPVRHGRWIDTYGDSWTCSVCGAESYFNEDWRGKDDKSYLMNYCHYCGAKMDKEVD
jgi:DNA-directed RNA polymerase subunit RPC12/RpoP